MSRSKQPIYRRLIGTLVNVVRCVVSTFLPELVFSVLSHELKPKGNVDRDTFTTFSVVANYIVAFY